MTEQKKCVPRAATPDTRSTYRYRSDNKVIVPRYAGKIKPALLRLAGLALLILVLTATEGVTRGQGMSLGTYVFCAPALGVLSYRCVMRADKLDPWGD